MLTMPFCTDVLYSSQFLHWSRREKNILQLSCNGNKNLTGVSTLNPRQRQKMHNNEIHNFVVAKIKTNIRLKIRALVILHRNKTQEQ